jgi:hypothetical protein
VLAHVDRQGFIHLASDLIRIPSFKMVESPRLGICYLTKTYLPRTLREEDWLG